MCIVALALSFHPDYPLIVIANRDEFYDRPTAPARFWPEKPHILGGRDLFYGTTDSTWMGISTSGRFATLTNYLTSPEDFIPYAKKRGLIPVEFLESNLPPVQFVEQLRAVDGYNPFNILTYHDGVAAHYSNIEEKVNILTPGIHGLCNSLLDTPWPKVQRLKERLHCCLLERIDQHRLPPEDLFDLLRDETKADDEDLPHIDGVPYDFEKNLSSIFTHMDDYGTRSSTIITMHHTGIVDFWERNYGHGGAVAGWNAHESDRTRHFRFAVKKGDDPPRVGRSRCLL